MRSSTTRAGYATCKAEPRTAPTIDILPARTGSAHGARERFALRIPPREITTFVSFLLVVGVILPVLPDQGYTPFDLNPRRTWLVVVAVSGLSYASYVAQMLVQARESVLLTALLGGAYSSTATTLVLARRSREQPDVSTYAGAIVLASGVMYVRLTTLVLLFAPAPGFALAPRLLGLAVGQAPPAGSLSTSVAAPTSRSGWQRGPSSVTLSSSARPSFSPCSSWFSPS